jgi:hypothetical protein
MVRGRRPAGCRWVPTAVAIIVGLATVCGCASKAGSAAMRVSSAASLSVASAPPGSAAAILPPPSASPFILDSGELLIAGSDVPPAYEVHVTVTITSQPDGVSSSNAGPATEYEVALVRIIGQSGSFHYADEDFTYLSANGGLYPPLSENAGDRFGKALAPATVNAGQTVEGYIAFHVPTGGGQVRFSYGSIGSPAIWRSAT